MLRHIDLILQRFIFVTIMEFIALHLTDEFYCIELPSLIAASKVDLTEPADCQTVVYLIFNSFGMWVFMGEWMKKFSFFYLSFLQTEPIIEVDITINRLEANCIFDDFFGFIGREVCFVEEMLV